MASSPSLDHARQFVVDGKNGTRTSANILRRIIECNQACSFSGPLSEEFLFTKMCVRDFRLCSVYNVTKIDMNINYMSPR